MLGSILGLISVLANASPAPLLGKIKIGHINSLTGAEAAFGQGTDRGIQLAIEHTNSTGGVRGKALELITLDDQGRSDEAVTAITKLLSREKVIGVIGESASSRTLAMAPIAQSHRVPLVSPSATNPKVTQIGNFIFRVCFIDPYQGPVVARFARKNLKVSRAAILRDVRNDYSVGLANYFIEAFKKDGGQIVADEKYSAGDIDFRAQLSTIKASNPEAIFIPGYYTDVGLIARQAREIGLKQYLLGGDGWDAPSLVAVGGAAMEKSYFANHYSTEDTSPKVKTFVDAYRKRYQEDPTSSAALGYDALMVLADAIRRATDETPVAVRDALASTKNVAGVTGSISIDSERNAVKPAVILKVENGKFKYEATVTL